MTAYPELASLATRHVAVATVVAEFRRPLRIQVAGRGSVGRSTVVRALGGDLEETAPVDAIDTPPPVLDGDAVIYVVAGSARRSDEAVLREIEPSRLFVVANKADMFTELAAEAVPLVATIALHLATDPPDAADVATLAAIDDSGATASVTRLLGADVARRERLLARWELFGVRTAVTALRAGKTDPAAIGAALRAACGIDRVRAGVDTLVTRTAAARGQQLLDALERVAVRRGGPDRDAIETYLRGDEATGIGMVAAWANPGLADVIGAHRMTEPADGRQALQMAAWWRRHAAGLDDAVARRAAIRIHDGYMNRWTAIV